METLAKPKGPPTASADFDRAYRAPFTFWGDVRIPPEVVDLARDKPARRILELGCGVGRFSRHLARAGHQVVGIDFSPAAIEKARARVAGDAQRPEFVVSDVTDLRNVEEPFDLSFDVGCYHCLNPDQQARYAAEVYRLLRPGGTHLIWVLDDATPIQQMTSVIAARNAHLFASRVATRVGHPEGVRPSLRVASRGLQSAPLGALVLVLARTTNPVIAVPRRWLARAF